jgi:hypothetical protein
MIPTDAVPMVVVALLLLSAGGADVDRTEVLFDGEHTVTDADGALLVAGGSVTVPAGATVEGPVYVTGGELTVAGRVVGDVTLLAGDLRVVDGGEVTGVLDALAGRPTVAAGASVGEVRTVDVTPGEPSPLARYGLLGLQVAVLAGAAALLGRRAPGALANVADSVTGHALLSGVAGLLAGLTLLVLFVYMAFTLLLLPVTVLGLLGLLVVAGYGYVALGYALGRHLPVERTDLASALGAGAVVLGVEALGRVPHVGGLLQLSVVVVGFGAVLLTYFGLREFEPARIPEGSA